MTTLLIIDEAANTRLLFKDEFKKEGLSEKVCKWHFVLVPGFPSEPPPIQTWAA